MERFAVDSAALDRALAHLSLLDAQATERARSALGMLLSGVAGSPWADVAWAFSRLTGDGFPVELTFTSEGAAIRYTSEVAGPEIADAERLPRAEALMARLGAGKLPMEIRKLLRTIQLTGPLRYGAWIGGRHDAAGDQYKLYAEVPSRQSEQAADLVGSLLGAAPLLPDRPTPLRMIGYDPGAARIEIYFAIECTRPTEVASLAVRARPAPAADDLLGLLAEAGERPTEKFLRGVKIGCSYSTGLNGGPLVFSLFVAARTLFGGDARIRRRLLSLSEQKGWCLSGYEQISAPLAGRTCWRTWHGLVGFVLLPDAPTVVHIGLRPPS